MDIAGNLAEKTAEYIYKNVENSSSVAILRFAIIVVINFFITSFVVLIICWLTGNFLFGVIAIICTAILRYFSGGVHLKSPDACNIVSVFMLILAVHLQISFLYTGLILLIISTYIIMLYAPQGITNLSRLDEKYYPVIKIISLLIVGSNFYFQSPLLSLVFFFQSLTILPITHKIVTYYKI